MNGYPSAVPTASATAEPQVLTKFSRDSMNEEMFAAAREGNADRLRELVKAGADPEARNAEGFTALMIATIEKQAGAVLALIYAGADPEALGPNDKTALILAAAGGSREIAAILINAGAECNEDTPEEARKAGHYGLANSLEFGALHRLYKKRLRQRQQQEHRREAREDEKQLSHLFEKSSEPPETNIARIRGFCGRLYSKFAAKFISDAQGTEAPEAKVGAENEALYARALSFARRSMRQFAP